MTAGAPDPGTRLPGAVLAIFFLSIAANIADRQLMAIMAETIKRDLALSDTEVGALTGLVFAVFFASVGIPVAGWADRADRARILGWTTIVSSVFTALSGAAQGFAALAGARAGVAVGDAGGAPTIWSLVCSFVPEAARARTIALIQIGAPVGGMIAFFGGGLFAEHLGWRWAFIMLGGLGVLLGIAALLVVPEPRRDAATTTGLPLSHALSLLWRRPGFGWVMAGVAYSGMAMFGLGSWGPSVLQRVYGLSPSQAGLVVGGSTIVAGAAAVPLIALQAVAVAAIPAIALFALATFMVLAWNAPSIAGLQLLADNNTRALGATLCFWRAAAALPARHHPLKETDT